MRRSNLFVILLANAAIIPASAQTGRGTIIGTVTDASGAVVPGVQITALDTATGGRHTVASNSVGNYLIPSLPAAVYAITFEMQGFKRVTWPDIEVSVAAVRRLDVRLEAGAVTESVEVTAAAPRLQTDSANVGATLGARDITSLALAISNGGRLIEFLAYQIMPGVSGDPRYSTTSHINGTTTYAQESLVDGASAVTNGGYGFNKISPEAVGEFNFQTSGISAEYGRAQAAVSNIVLKSGANEVHGSGFGSVWNEVFNARPFWYGVIGSPRPAVRQFDMAGSFGGPVYLPKIYDGRNKTFFYGSYERYISRTRQSLSVMTIPLTEMYDGDMSALLQSSGKGAIYDPSTFRQLANGSWTGEMFPGNVIPSSRISKVSRNLGTIAKANYVPNLTDSSGRTLLTNNYKTIAAATYETDQYFFSLKMDHYFSAKHKLSGSFIYHANDSSALSGLVNKDLENGGPLATVNHSWTPGKYPRLSFDSTLSPTVLNHLTLHANRFLNSILPVNQKNQAAALGIANVESLGYPGITWGSGAVTTFTNPGTGNLWYVADTTWGIADTVNFSKGRHLMKAGYDFRRFIQNRRRYAGPSFTFSATSTAIPNSSLAGTSAGHAFASYLLGNVYSFSLSEPISIGGRKTFQALFFQDDFKVSPRLTLNLGVRWEYQPPYVEISDRWVSWNTSKIDPASGLPGAYDFAGACEGCTGQRYFGQRDWNNFSPRFGMAYRAGKGLVIRAAYGINYEGDVNNGTLPFGYTFFAATGTYSPTYNATQPWAGTFNWDNGLPTDRYIAPSKDVSYASKSAPFRFDPSYGIAGYVQTWNLNLQKELPGRLLLDTGYVGNKGTGLTNGSLSVVNQLPTSVLATYGSTLGNSVKSAADAAKYGIAYPYAGYSGTVGGALRPYPQVYGNSTVTTIGAPLGFSTYHSLQVVVNRQFSRGLSLYGNYVLSKNLSNMETAAELSNTGPADYYNLALAKTVAAYDQTHVFKVYANYDLPVGRGKTFLSGAGRFLNLLVGGWSASIIANYASPGPMAFTTNKSLSGWNGKYYPVNIGSGDIRSASFDKNSIFPIAYSDWYTSPKTQYLNTSMFSDSTGYSLGTAGIRVSQYRSFWARNENISLQKSFTFAEKYRLQIRADAFNALNRHTFNSPTTSISSATFGRMTVGGNRTMQVDARLDF